MEIIVRIFVYGSLKKSFHNHHILNDSEFVGEATTEFKYHMISYDGFPAVIENSKKHHVSGEIYIIGDDVLRKVDYLESNGTFYQRNLIPVIGYDYLVWMYFIIDEETALSLDKIAVTDSIATWIK